MVHISYVHMEERECEVQRIGQQGSKYNAVLTKHVVILCVANVTLQNLVTGQIETSARHKWILVQSSKVLVHSKEHNRLTVKYIDLLKTRRGLRSPSALQEDVVSCLLYALMKHCGLLNSPVHERPCSTSKVAAWPFRRTMSQCLGRYYDCVLKSLSQVAWV